MINLLLTATIAAKRKIQWMKTGSRHTCRNSSLERFFTQRLMQQRRVSPHTISSYRDTFRLLLKFAQERMHKPPSQLMFEEVDAPSIVAFLEHLEKQRRLSARSRNLRLTAIRSFFRYAAFETPAHSAQIQRVLAIPSKRFTRTLVRFLSALHQFECGRKGTDVEADPGPSRAAA